MSRLRMPELNSVIIAGNLTKAPVLRHTRSGTPVANFTIASNRKFRDGNNDIREDVCYIGIVAWSRLAENCESMLAKGSAVVVEGELQSKSWSQEDGKHRTAIEIKARRVQFLSKGSETSDDLGEDHDGFINDIDYDDDRDGSQSSSFYVDGYPGRDGRE